MIVCFGRASSAASSTALTPTRLVGKQSQSSAVIVTAARSLGGSVATAAEIVRPSSSGRFQTSNGTVSARPPSWAILMFAPPISSATQRRGA